MPDPSVIFTGKVFSFAEIVQDRTSSVQVTDDGFLYAVDLVMVMTGKDRNYAGQTLRRLSEEEFSSCKLQERQLRAGLPTKVISFHDSIELVMALPGKKAKRVKTQFANIIRRYLAGDHTLISEIRSNEGSSALLSTLARQSIDISEMPHTNVGTKHKLDHDSEVRTNVIVSESQSQIEFKDFVRVAFEYQKEVIQLQHKQQIQEIDACDEDDEFEQYATGLSDPIKKENIVLASNIQAKEQLNIDLEKDLGSAKLKLKDAKIALAEIMFRAKVLSGSMGND